MITNVAGNAATSTSCPSTTIIGLSQVHTQWHAYNPNRVPLPIIDNNNDNTKNLTATTSDNNKEQYYSYSKTRGTPHYFHAQLTLSESFIINEQIGNFILETFIKGTNTYKHNTVIIILYEILK